MVFITEGFFELAIQSWPDTYASYAWRLDIVQKSKSFSILSIFLA